MTHVQMAEALLVGARKLISEARAIAICQHVREAGWAIDLNERGLDAMASIDMAIQSVRANGGDSVAVSEGSENVV